MYNRFNMHQCALVPSSKLTVFSLIISFFDYFSEKSGQKICSEKNMRQHFPR